MTEADGTIYEDLAECHERLRELRQRDLFLVLAADAALTCGRRDHAERLRGRLLQVSPYHMLRPFPTFADALQSADIQDYVLALRQQFPPAKAARLLQGMKQGTLVVAPAPTPAEGLNAFDASTAAPPFLGIEAPPDRPDPTARIVPAFVATPPAASPSASAPPEPTYKATTELAWVPTLLFLVVLILSAYLAGHQLFLPWLRHQP